MKNHQIFIGQKGGRKMLTQKLLNITNKISELEFFLTAYIDGTQEEEMELLQQLTRNLKSMHAIVRAKNKHDN